MGTTTSPILAMHARYEANEAEYETIDEAAMRLGNSDADRALMHRYKDAMTTSERECDALRRAILFQVPDTMAEAAIFQFHIHIQYDLIATSTADDPDRDALTTAIDTLFDFMVSELGSDQDAIGPRFKDGAERVRQLRRFRTAELEA